MIIVNQVIVNINSPLFDNPIISRKSLHVQAMRISLLISRVNQRRYEFGDEEAAADEDTHWVCAKIPSSGKVKKDCVTKV